MSRTRAGTGPRLRDGRADLDAVQRRHQTTGRFQTKLAARQDPAVYVAFDLLFHRGRSLISEPLVRRREILAETLGQVDPCRAVLSDGIVGAGTAWFEQVVRQGHEGAMAKHLAGRYLPGKRSSSWRKIKPTEARRNSHMSARKRETRSIQHAKPPRFQWPFIG